MRLFAAIIFLGACLAGVGFIFWHQEMKYALPTRKPQNYREVVVGTDLQLSEKNRELPSAAAFLHFYNPDCPCSRFNATHLRQLIRSYQDSVPVIIVVPSKAAEKKAKREFGNEQQYVTDIDNRIANSCGVYSTPQAALVDATGALFYRGNYNRSRYCTSKATNFAELALVAMLNHQRPPVFIEEATTAYGCTWNENLISLE